jgi:hypothetical protein
VPTSTAATACDESFDPELTAEGLSRVEGCPTFEVTRQPVTGLLDYSLTSAWIQSKNGG